MLSLLRCACEVSCSTFHYVDYLKLDSFFFSCFIMACLNCSYMLCMLFMVSKVLLSVEYLHSMSCRHLLPLYEGSSTSFP